MIDFIVEVMNNFASYISELISSSNYVELFFVVALFLVICVVLFCLYRIVFAIYFVKSLDNSKFDEVDKDDK